MDAHKKNQLVLLQGLIECEETLSHFYAACARRFTQHRDFWSRLASDEHSHAEILRVLYDKCRKTAVNMNERRFSPQAVRTSLTYLKEITAQVGQAKIPLPRALSLARDVENSLIEKKFYEVFSGESEELKRVFRTLEESTREHRNRLEALAADPH